MGGQDALEGFVPGDHDLLVKIVKETQRRGSAGSKGPWKSFLATLPRGDPSKPIQNDPARRDWQTLAAFCATLTTDEDVDLVRRMRGWFAWLREEERLERDDPFPDSPEQGLVARTRAHPTYKQAYDLPAYQEGWALSRRGGVSDAPSRTRLLSVDCEMCKAEGNAKELVRLSVVDQSLEVLLSEFVKPSAKVLDYRTEITGASAKLLGKVTYSHADAQKAVLELLSEPGTILVGHGLQHDLRALRIDHRRVIDTSLIFSYQGLPTAIPSLGDLCRAVLEVGFREGGPEQAHDSIEDAKIPMRLVLHEMKKGPTAPLAVPDFKVDKSELSKLFLHKIPKGTPREDLARAFASELGAHVQMATWGASGMGTTFALFKNPEVANAAFKALVGKEHKDALGRAQKSVTVLPPADAPEGQKVTFTVRKMGCHNGAAFGVKKKGSIAAEGLKDGVTKLENGGKEKVKKGLKEGGRNEKINGVKKGKEARGEKINGIKKVKEAKGKGSGEDNGAEERRVKGNGSSEKGALPERVKQDEEVGGESAKKATKHGKSSAERRRAKRALQRGDGVAGGVNREKMDGQERTGSDTKGRKGSEKDEKRGKGSERNEKEKKRKRRMEGESADGEAAKEKGSKGKESKKRRVSEEGGEKHKRRSLDGLLDTGVKRKRGDGEGRGEKRARRSEPSATQQTLMEIQKLLASVGKSGGIHPNGKDSTSKKSREGNVRREFSEHRSKSRRGEEKSGEKRRTARKEERNKDSERKGESERKSDSKRKRDREEKEGAKGAKGSEKKLKRELAKKDDQLATLTKLVLVMAKTDLTSA